MSNRNLKNIEWWILILAILLCVVGFVALYSATQSDNFETLKKQIIWFVISIVIMIIISFIDYICYKDSDFIFYKRKYYAIFEYFLYDSRFWTPTLTI